MKKLGNLAINLHLSVGIAGLVIGPAALIAGYPLAAGLGSAMFIAAFLSQAIITKTVKRMDGLFGALWLCSIYSLALDGDISLYGLIAFAPMTLALFAMLKLTASAKLMKSRHLYSPNEK